MSAMIDEQTLLEQDSSLSEPLRRVAYEAGMMLGVEATRDEQSYHRRRLTRQQYWLHGYGTVCGMRVAIDPESATDPNEDGLVRVLVHPGVGLDRLGREILVHEMYCLNLREWLEAQQPETLLEGYDEDNDILHLQVFARYKPCEVAQQPVLARQLNFSTDAVAPSRSADAIQLSIAARLPDAADTRYRPFGAHNPVDDALPTLNDDEQAMIDAASGAEQDQLEMAARMLHALGENSGVDPQALQEALDREADLLLASVSINQVDDIDNILLNPERIAINNLIRPFVVNASQLAWQARQP